MERGLSSESNSVSSPPTPSNRRFYICHLNSSTFICMGYLPEKMGLAVEHIDVLGLLEFDD